MANLVFNYFKQAVMQGSLNLQSAAANKIMVALVNNSAAAGLNIDTHKYFGMINGTYEISGAAQIAYTAGGKILSSPNVQQDDTGNQGVLFGTAILWASSTITAAGAVLYASSGNGYASDPLICFVDFTANQTSSNGNFQINWAATGILALT
jgi:hypothetical protein